MPRAVTRSPFHNSPLIRILTDLSVLETAGSGAVFAEKLGQWVGFAEAIALHGVHNASIAGTLKFATPAAPDEVFALTRARLEKAILESYVPPEDPITYTPYHRLYLAHQRDMELKVRQLRASVREQIARVSPALKQLTALDASFDNVLAEREKKLLSTLPLLMEKRFQHLRTVQPEPQTHLQAPVWLSRFCHELQTVLLAELDLRLQTTLGLIEAFNDQQTQHA